MSKSGFRILVIVSALVGLASLVLHIVATDPQALPSVEHNAWVGRSLVVGLLAWGGITTVGLLLFWRHARWLLVSGYLLTLSGVLWFGLQWVDSPLALVMVALNNLLAGFAICASYYTNVRFHFAAERNIWRK